ncbi:MAG TPA: HipA N-terminal domain-containing protein [Gracilimonas sp.]|uniref:HipA N-terminal domain-containing protein n=1 Tax=Gracilimonas sp. TaxID=1974203 RepID=UPI002D896BBF|nr:HipA N-terminal domain-containing protein [Gracilimonas sp.]
MRKAEVYMHKDLAGFLIEEEINKNYRFRYERDYHGAPVSVTMPVEQKEFEFDEFPPFFEGLLPEGINLESLLRTKKIDRNDRFSQLIAVGEDTVGAVSVREVQE